MIITQIDVRWHQPKHWNDLTEWQLLTDLTINGYTIPKGFYTDGGSIPFGFRNSFNPTGKGFLSFIAHDHKTKRNDYPRVSADEEFYRDLKDCGVNRFRAKAMYCAVRSYAVIARKK